MLEVSLNGSNWNFCKHEGGAPDLRETGPTEGMFCKALQACLEAARLIAHPSFEWCGPIPLHEIVAAVKQ